MNLRIEKPRGSPLSACTVLICWFSVSGSSQTPCIALSYPWVFSLSALEGYIAQADLKLAILLLWSPGLLSAGVIGVYPHSGLILQLWVIF